MTLYNGLSQIKFLKTNYAYKFLFVAFIGIHIPLIGILFYVLYGSQNISAQTILLFALVMTLVATAATLYFLKQLIKPIETASKALNNYRNEGKIPFMPTNFTDEAGLLMSNIQKSIIDNEQFKSDKQDLIYLLSHDFKNFTANSQGLAQLILDEDPSHQVSEYTNLILNSTNQQFEFIKIFTNLLKDEEEIENRALHTKEIDFHVVIKMVRDQINQKLIAKKIQLITVIHIDKTNLLIAEDLLVRILVNLIDNAIKFSFSNSEIRLIVHTAVDQVIIEVTDSGIGFKTDKKEELYTKFTKRSQLGTANEPSTGIGLYLCRKIVQKYEGEFTLHSDGINQGAKFSVIFNQEPLKNSSF